MTKGVKKKGFTESFLCYKIHSINPLVFSKFCNGLLWNDPFLSEVIKFNFLHNSFKMTDQKVFLIHNCSFRRHPRLNVTSDV